MLVKCLDRQRGKLKMFRKLILVIGNNYFGKKIINELKNEQKTLRFVVLNPSGSNWDRWIYVLLVPFSNLVWTVSGSLNGGMSLKLAVFLKKRILQLFIGTDVLQTAEVIKKGLICRPLVKQSILISGAPWLADEMQQLGFPAPYVSDYVYGIPKQPDPMPQEFSILTYVGQGKEELYGLPWVMACAKNFPDIQIRIAGMDRTSWSLPDNIKLLGRVSLQQELKKTSLLLRVTRHDGMGHTVIEALGMGRWVIRTNNMPGVIYVKNEAELLNQVQELYSKFKKGELDCNWAGFEYVKKEFSRERVLKNLMRWIDQSIK